MFDTNPTARGLTHDFVAIDDAATTLSVEQPSLQDRLSEISEPIQTSLPVSLVKMEVSFDYTPNIGQADYEAAMLGGQTREATEAADFRNIRATDYRPALNVRNPLDKDGNPVGGFVLHPQNVSACIAELLNFGSSNWEPKKVEAMPVTRDSENNTEIVILPQAQSVSTSILTPEEARLGWSHPIPVQVSIEPETNTPRVETPQELGDRSIQRAYSSTTITRGISDLEKTDLEERALSIADSTDVSPFVQRATKP
jgi:hypothetical protein